MKGAAFVLVPALAVVIAGAASVRGRSREELPVSPRKPARAAATPTEAVPSGPSTSGSLAFRMLAILREQRELRERMKSGSLTETQRRRLGTLDVEGVVQAQALSKLLRGDAEAWRDVIAILSFAEDQESARELVLAVRGELDPASEAFWIEGLRTGGRAEARRLDLVALARRSSDAVARAVAQASQEDSDAAVRAEALTTLANLRHQPMSEQGLQVIRETLRQRKAAEQDPSVRERAAGLVVEINRASVPPQRPPARSLFSRGSKSRPASSNP